MKKWLFYTVFLLLGMSSAKAQDTTLIRRDTTVLTLDSAVMKMLPKDILDLIARDSSDTDADDELNEKSAADSKAEETPTGWDKRWFISPFLRFQMKDFGMLEKNKLGFESNSHELSITDKAVVSLAASVYKNFSGRVSASIDIGVGSGHVTANGVPVAQSKAQTFNLLNASLYLHLLKYEFRLQPYVTAGFNNLISDDTYMSVPVGAGFKYSGKKVMALAQAAYGYSISDNMANTMMYSAGVYLPIKSKKQKKEEEEQKKQEEEEKKKKEDKNRNGTIINIVNNYYYANGKDSSANGKETDSNGEDIRKKTKWYDDPTEQQRPYDPEEPMTFNKAKRYIVYFNYDEYVLTDGAIDGVENVIRILKQNKKLRVHLKGHTDMKGSEAYNTPLSRRRAEAVYNYMRKRGISSDRMLVSHFGKGRPVIQNEDPNTAWMNRRTEIVIYEDEEPEE